LNVNRPFIYVITDDVTGEVLFVGRVLDPTAR
jgi:serine protease inhibitor